MNLHRSAVALLLVLLALNGEARALVFPGVETSNAESYALSDGQTLTVSIDGGVDTVITFSSADFSSIGTATAEEVTAVLKRDLTEAFCYSSNSGTKVVIETKGSGTNASVQVTGGTANAVLGFPTTVAKGNWVPMTQALYGLGDPGTDGSNNGREIIGCDKDDADDAGSICDSTNRNEDLPAVYIYNDGSNFFVRMRLDSNPEQAPGNLRPYGWGILLDTDGDYADYEYSLMADGIGSTEVVEFAQNVDKTSVGDPSDEAEVPLYTDSWSDEQICGSWGCGNGRVNVSCDSSAELCFSGNNDYFLDYGVPLWYLTDQPDIDFFTSITFWAGTSNNARTITVDLANTTSGPTAGALLCTGSNPMTLGGCTSTTAAKVENNVAETFALADGDTLTVEIDGGGVQTITFSAADFVNISAATAVEVASSINGQLVGGTATATSGDTHVTIASDSLGSASTVEVTGGTANAELDFCLIKKYGTDGDSDVDGDGFCSYEDCDDNDPKNYPGNAEECDLRDNDCDGEVDEGFDSDADGVTTCGLDGIPGTTDDDCDDTDGENYPGNVEVCNGADNDCDGQVDNGFDDDTDGVTVCGVDGIPGTADDDCNDNNEANYPGNTEVCDGADNDCDGEVDEGFDSDADGVTTCGPDGIVGTADDDCNDNNEANYPGNAEVCDGADNDCDTKVDNGFDDDTDGVTTCGPDGIPGTADDDCDDNNEANYPGNAEMCDGADNDCDTKIDNGFDNDGDGVTTCGADGVADTADDDCDDDDVDNYPGNAEVCDGEDNDCDTKIDNGFDNDSDGFTSCGADGTPDTADDDCDDNNEANYPGNAEVCDGADNNCDGLLDNGFDDDLDGVTTCGVDGIVGTADDDCDDTDADNYPGNIELCDAKDNNCNNKTDEGYDKDSDGVTTCGLDGMAGTPDDDCDDADSDNFPGNVELCDGADNDCDTLIDNDMDRDSDGVLTCGPDNIPGTPDDDCDDNDANNYPGNDEVCDGRDNDCDTQVDNGFDNDGDGVTSCGADGTPDTADDDCDDDDIDKYPGKDEVCDGKDNDCDTLIDNGFDNDGDGVTICGADGTPDTADDDCDDNDGSNYPGNAEVCDGADNDCDTLIDNGFDNDGDGVTICGADGTPYTADDDCDDDDIDKYPGKDEVCDGKDNDCDTQVDNGFDNDGDGVTICGADGTPDTADDDCDDDDVDNYPGNAEVCDGEDNDCDTQVDNGFDNDSDGFTSCGADGVPNTADDDCHDTEPDNFPGNAEVCDGKDNNCDGEIDEGFDTDLDGVTSCGPDGIPGTADDDCNDSNPNNYPGNAEVCDGADNDCDTLIDDGFDDDADGVSSCGPDGISGTADDDCDSTDGNNYPGNTEVCDGKDNNCDEQIDDGFDADSDGVTTCGSDGVLGTADDDCDDADPDNYPGNTEACDGADNDCDTLIDDGFDEDADGVSSCGPDGALGTADDDCDDADADNYPGNTEACDGADNNCDNQIDEGFDADLDGITTCGPDGVPGSIDDDCDDDNDEINPESEELCDGVDNNCDGQVDEGFDSDLDGVTSCGPDGIPGTADDDCDDTDGDNYPGNTEVCDEIDNNCNGQADEGLGDLCKEADTGTDTDTDTDTDSVSEMTEEEALCGPGGCVATGGTCACVAAGQTGHNSKTAYHFGLIILALGFYFGRRRQRREKKRALLPFLFILVMVSPSPARAEKTKVDVQVFKPSPFMNDLYNIYLGDTREEKVSWNAGLYLNYQHDPLVMRASESGEVVSRVIEHQLTADVLAALSIFNWWEVGIGVPIIIYQDGEGFPDQVSPASAAVGDLRLHTKLRLFKSKGGLFSLSFSPYVTFPIGTQMDPFAGSNGVTFVPTLAGSFHLHRFGLAINLGYLLVKSNKSFDVTFDDQLFLRLGGWFWLMREKLQAILELNAATVVMEAFQSLPETPIELLFGGRYFPRDWIHLDLGFGMGLTTGYAVPDFRLFAGLVIARPKKKSKEPVVRDSDGDGMIDSEDSCPTEPEDPDDFEDEDGCPDPDNDQDGIPDGEDKCPVDAEDKDDFEDEDGCPDPDNDQDGIPDGEDKCPIDAEDKDEFEDQDGCPDPDNDQDGILDEQDKCPLQPETANGLEDEDGCPDAKVVLTEEKIVINDKIYFKHDSKKIEEESFSLLDDVAAILKEHPEIEKVRIEGHTDSTGKKKYNMRLSGGRAGSVLKYLVKKGIDSKRLISEGYGPTKPVVQPEKTDADREKNRRVEFVILKRTEKSKTDALTDPPQQSP